MSLLENYKVEEAALKKAMRKVAGYSTLASLCLLVVPIYLFMIYDKVLFSQSIPTLLALSAIAVVVLIAYGVFDTTRLYLLAKAGVEFENKIAGPLVAGELSRQNDANRQSVNDLTTIRQVLATPSFAAIFDVPVMPIYFLIVFSINFTLGFVVLIGAALLFSLTVIAEKMNGPLTSDAAQAGRESSRSLEMHFSQQEMVRAQGLYREAINDWGQHQSKHLSKYLFSFMRQSAFSATSKSTRQLLQIALIGFGAFFVLDPDTALNPGVIFATSVVGSRALAPIEAIVGGWRNLKQAFEASKRLKGRLSEIELPQKRTPLPAPKGIIGLDRVIYVPRPGMPPILKGINGNIAAGDSVAIIGPSGAGKSTLARVLVGYLEPSAGSINLDGQSLKAWDPIARGLHMGYMPQQVNFFEASVGENIARLRRQDPPELAVQAAQLVGVHDMILKFPQGYDTPISKGGFWPSGGQAQLIGLARAFYGNPSVIVLDEPNAALDQMGEQIFHRSLAVARQRKMTTIVVTQRPSVLQFVDKVMILKDGQVDAFGPKDEIMKSNRVKAVNASQQAQTKTAQNTAANSAGANTAKNAGPNNGANVNSNTSQNKGNTPGQPPNEKPIQSPKGNKNNQQSDAATALNVDKAIDEQKLQEKTQAAVKANPKVGSEG
jgi:PrtD family type I secretion system ABC transporter